ncbi:uncharacterized protein LOC132258126 [Phlebotomus argentipes]|uniref:uncharacterized protein LOC132258126 n=1 Tax=Phlebotomus argentipes TaxID=94469 RepID=UPI0028931127|nr:uncharacterized protein LOC132258126 [Phlebotomus argentipes]
MRIIIFVIVLLTILHTSLPQDTSTTTQTPYPHHCHKCEGRQNIDHCSFYQPLNESIISDSDHTLCEEGTRRGCYISVEDGIVRRGCLGDGYCDTHECEECGLHYCNGESKAIMSCISCVSHPRYGGYDENCQDNAKKIEPTSCVTYGFRKEDMGCFSILTNDTRYNDIYVFRGCNHYLPYVNDVHRCFDENDHSCVICMEDGCNTHYVGLGAKVYPTVALLMLALSSILNKYYL